MIYFYMALAVAAEVVGTSALKATEGFTRLVPSLIVVAGYGTAIFLLTLVVKVLPVGVVYAIWSGLGTALIVVVAAFLYKQIPGIWEIVGVAMIVAGVVIINLLGDVKAH